MKAKITGFLLIFISLYCSGQDIVFEKNHRAKIPFKFENNSIILQVEINRVPVNLIMDTGAKNTVIINPSVFKTLQIKKAIPVKIKGLGQRLPLDGFLSRENTLSFKQLVVKNKTVVWLKDSIVDFSPYYNTPIDGFIGSDFLKDFVVEINFSAKYLILYAPEFYKKKHRTRFPVRLVNSKPAIRFYIAGKENVFIIDTGNTEALWYYKSLPEHHPYHLKYTYLGLGISGEIYGYASLIDDIVIGKTEFDKVPVSIPDSISKQHINIEANTGLIGNEILKKFKIILHYPGKYIVFKRNLFASKRIPYDKSGLIVKLTKPKLMEINYTEYEHLIEGKDKNGFVKIQTREVHKIISARNIRVEEIVPGSPAEKAGIIKGDIIEAVNGIPIYKLDGLTEFTAYLSQREGKKIKLKIVRNHIPMEISFRLKDYYKKNK
jgi:hypothetical protein